MRSLIVMATFMTLSLTLVFAGEHTGIIKKVDGNKVTFTKGFKKADAGEEITLPAVEKVKVSKGKFNKETMTLEADGLLEGGLKSEMVKGFARIITDKDDKNITEIIVGGFGKGKKKKDE
jgi:hypothetical protein